MKKLILNSAFGILAALACAHQALAALPAPICQNFEGTIVLSVDPECQILTRSDTRVYFPDLLSPSSPSQFLGFPGTCFTGEINGTLNNQPVTGESYSGQTTNNFPALTGFGQLAFSAATTLVLKNQGGISLGAIYFQDTGLINLSDGQTQEQLVAVGANGLFWSVKGTVQIGGDEFLGAPFIGQFCR
ncbi:MAG: hypothetical protein KDJ28_09965 [Candidatus Competibacteraceae bacterium]|nr:hypothetical protein [Candidatus Competibacteraceae bacterium]